MSNWQLTSSRFLPLFIDYPIISSCRYKDASFGFFFQWWVWFEVPWEPKVGFHSVSDHLEHILDVREKCITDRRMDRQTKNQIEMRGRIFKLLCSVKKVYYERRSCGIYTFFKLKLWHVSSRCATSVCNLRKKTQITVDMRLFDLGFVVSIAVFCFWFQEVG